MLNWIMANSDQLIKLGSEVIAAAAIVTNLTPTPKDDTVLGKIYKVVDFVAMNSGKAKQLGSVAAAMAEANRLMDAESKK